MEISTEDRTRQQVPPMDSKILFPMNTRIHAIPFWVASALRRKNASFADLLDYTKVSQILSQNDMASVEMFHHVANETLNCVGFDKYERIFNEFFHTDQVSEESRNATQQLRNRYSLNSEFREDMVSRLYSEEANSSSDVAISRNDPECGFEVIALRDQAICVVLYNSVCKHRYSVDLAYKVLRAIVKQLYVYEHASAVHQSYVYGLYLRTLRLTQSVAA